MRRRFYELHVSGGSEIATATIERMSRLWGVEEDVRGKAPDMRATARQDIAVPIVAELFTLWQNTLPRISGKSKLAEAIRYAISRRTTLERFLTNGRIEIDSNVVERAIRPQTITRNYAKSRIMRSYRGGQRRRRQDLGDHRDLVANG